MVGGVTETWVVFGRTPVQKGLMAPSPSWAQGGTQHGLSGQMDLRKTMNIPSCERNRMTLRPEGSTEVMKKPHKGCCTKWSHRSSKMLLGTERIWETWTNRSFATNLRDNAAVVLSCLSCPTLRHYGPYVACHAPVHGVLQARILEWVTVPSSRGSSWSRDWSHVS